MAKIKKTALFYLSEYIKSMCSILHVGMSIFLVALIAGVGLTMGAVWVFCFLTVMVG